MAKKKTKNQPKKKQVNAENVIGLHSEVTDQPITQTLEVNYMPYAMSVNVSRAFPEIDGFKPSHRKLLYTMYKMGLLKGERQKSANIVGVQTYTWRGVPSTIALTRLTLGFHARFSRL